MENIKKLNKINAFFKFIISFLAETLGNVEDDMSYLV